MISGNRALERKNSMSRKKPRPQPQDLVLPPGGADSHAHLTMGDLAKEIDEVIIRARECGVTTIGNVVLGSEAYEKQHMLFDNLDQVFLIHGVHPHEARHYSDDEHERIWNAVKHNPRVKAVGETGLDYFYKHSPVEEQQKAFKMQLEMASSLDLPVVVHSRDAYEDTIKILMDMGFRDRPLLWHCFGQGPDEAKKIMAMGWHISIPGSVTFKKNDALRRAAAIIELDRMLMETDCPFLAPEPYRGKQNEPALMVFTAQKIAEIKDMDLEKVWIQAGDNCRNFFQA